MAKLDLAGCLHFILCVRRGRCGFGFGRAGGRLRTGGNEFTIDFVTIMANPGESRSTNTNGDSVMTFTSGAPGAYSDYTDPGHDYRIGVYEITNDQWNKFKL